MSFCNSGKLRGSVSQMPYIPIRPSPRSHQEKPKQTNCDPITPSSNLVKKEPKETKSGRLVPVSRVPLLFCKHCDSNFSRRGALNRHVKNFHPDKEFDQSGPIRLSSSFHESESKQTDSMHSAPISSLSLLMCNHCNVSFTRKSGLNRHLKHFHDNGRMDIQANQICPVCEHSLRTIYMLVEHIRNEHPEITLKIMEMTFHCFEDFEKWKLAVEAESKSHFVNRSAKRKLSSGRFATYYYCHRSGKQDRLLTDKRCRRMKRGGSLKIGKTCPAFIRMYYEQHDEAMQILVTYQSVHVGHRTELKSIPLNKDQKLLLAEQMALGVPKSELLEKIKKEYSPTERMSLITRKDLHNICREFHIKQERESLSLLRSKKKAKKIADLVCVENSEVDGMCFSETVEEEFVIDETPLDFHEPNKSSIVMVEKRECSATNNKDNHQVPSKTSVTKENNQTEISGSTVYTIRGLEIRVVPPDFEYLKTTLSLEFQKLLAESQSIEQLQILWEMINTARQKWVTS